MATAFTTAIAYVAVEAAGAGVTDRPLTVITALEPSSTAPLLTTTTTQPTSTITTVASPSTSSPSTTAAPPPPTTSTSAPELAWDQQTINSVAGKVVVSFRGEEVRLESVAPLAGYTYEVDKAGPDEVRVELEGQLRVEIRARIRDGQLITEVNENN